MRRIAALCVFSLVVGAAASTAVPAEAAGGRSVLTAGHSWTGIASAASPSGQFRLGIYFYGLQLDQDIDTKVLSVGTTVWMSKPRANGRCSRPQLTMQTDGAAVLHCGTHRLWATPTRGSGSANTFRIRDDGQLVVRTGTGHIVWRSGSGPAMLAAGHRLLPGQALRNCTVFGRCTSLTMRRNGDLVLAYGKRVNWHTGTGRHPGAALVFGRTGALQVVGPRGRVLWRAHTGGIGPASYLIVGYTPSGTGARVDLWADAHPKFRWWRD
jgi:hypothetical protein